MVVLPPDDAFNRALVEATRPADWTNPAPAACYNLVVLGGGPAGLVSAAIAAGLAARVALVEKHRLGGDCLHSGCVPSKALLRAARARADVGAAGDFGVRLPGGAEADFAAAMARLRRLRARLSVHDSAARFRSLGVDVFLGAGRFVAPDTIEVDGQALRFVRAALCTGSRPAIPPVAGLAETGYLTSETVFGLTDLPRRLAVLGGGPIGCELAQAFARLGSTVTLLEQAPRLLPRDDADAARLVEAQLRDEGVRFFPGASLRAVEKRGGEKVLRYDSAEGRGEVPVDEVLVATGRSAVVEGLGLEAAGIARAGHGGVQVDDWLRTTNPRVYAAGDVCSRLQLTHAADAQAQVLVQNALFPHPFGLGRASAAALIVPRCTYTTPEVAQVGLTIDEARQRGVAVETYTVGLEEVDRAVLDGEEAGFVRLLVHRGTGRLAGATVVAAHAGEMIGEVTALLRAGQGVATLATTIHPYPTQADGLRRAALAWRKAHFTGRKKALLSRLFRWMRGG